MLAMQAAALDQLDSLSSLSADSLPSVPNPVPVRIPVRPPIKSLPVQNSLPPKNEPPETPEIQCAPAAKYFLTAWKLNEYLNATLPQEIEKLVKCEEVNIAGLLGDIIDIIGDSDFLSLLDVSSILDTAGGGGLGGLGSLLGQESDSKSPKFPSLSKTANAAGSLLPMDQGGLVNSLLSGRGDKSPLKGFLDSTHLSSLQQPLNGVVEKASSLKHSAMDTVTDALPSDVKDAVSGLLGGVDLKEFLLGLEVKKVSVESMNSTVTNDGIYVLSSATATIGGNGLAGPAIDVMGFQVHLNITLKAVIAANSTECVSLEVQETNIQVKKVTLQIFETVTDTMPLPMPLPLKDIIPKVLSIEIEKNVHTLLDKTAVPVPGGLLPPHPKDAHISITLSGTMLKKVVTQVAKWSTIKAENMEISISKITYIFQPDGSTVRVTYWSNIRRDGENFATAETVSAENEQRISCGRSSKGSIQ
ncbi:vomeromodulin-like [Ctenodactylus gundi]